MKKCKTILLKAIFYLTAFQILNLSIDIDCLVTHSALVSYQDFDDIDSFAELLVEQATGNSHYFSENDDDYGMHGQAGIEKADNMAFYCEQAKTIRLAIAVSHNNPWPSGIDLLNRTCKGYPPILTPPPDRS